MLDVVEELFQQGVELHKSGKVEVASQLYTAVLKAQPEHPDANHNMGVLAVDVGKVQEALPFFEAALEANADTAQFWLSYIDALINVGEWLMRKLCLIKPRIMALRVRDLISLSKG